MANDAFAALAHPTRRRIVERLSVGPGTVGEASRDLGVSKPTISRHLKLLEEAGVVTRVIDGRNHRLALRPETLAETAEWIERQRARWERLFDVVDEYLDEQKERRLTEHSGRVVRVERTFDAPAEAVFDAWTSPEVMRRWFHAGPDWETPEAEVDLRVGGRMMVRMKRPDGTEHVIAGEYTEVDRPRRVVISCTFSDDPDTEQLVELTFSESDGSTKVVLVNSGMSTDGRREAQDSGWRRCLDNLEGVLNARS